MILPSGNRKTMFAQSYLSKDSGFEDNAGMDMEGMQIDSKDNNLEKNIGSFDALLPKDEISGKEGPIQYTPDENSAPENIQKDTTSEVSDENLIQQPKELKENKKDLGDYIFQLLEGFGYPPRRLEEFSDQFVEEKIYPGGIRDVTIVIPDRYWGTRTRISEKDFSKMVEHIQNNFNLSFLDGERKDKKINIHFSSKKEIPQDQVNQDAMVNDDLDAIYGKGSGGSKQKAKTDNKTVSASLCPVGLNKKIVASPKTQSELIKLSQEEVLQLLFSK